METKQNKTTSETLLILSLLIGAFLSTLNMTNINIALPTLMTYFHTDMATVQWIVVGFMLTNGSNLSCFIKKQTTILGQK